MSVELAGLSFAELTSRWARKLEFPLLWAWCWQVLHQSFPRYLCAKFTHWSNFSLHVVNQPTRLHPAALQSSDIQWTSGNKLELWRLRYSTLQPSVTIMSELSGSRVSVIMEIIWGRLARITRCQLTVPALGAADWGVTQTVTESSCWCERQEFNGCFEGHRSYYAQDMESLIPCRIRQVSVPWTSRLTGLALTQTCLTE